jgi:hypothetical protein
MPAPARMGILSREFEAISHGRTAGVPLVAAYAIAANLRLPLEIDDGPKGGTRVKVTIPRSVTPLS